LNLSYFQGEECKYKADILCENSFGESFRCSLKTKALQANIAILGNRIYDLILVKWLMQENISPMIAKAMSIAYSSLHSPQNQMDFIAFGQDRN
jgi:hypothetical protein